MKGICGTNAARIFRSVNLKATEAIAVRGPLCHAGFGGLENCSPFARHKRFYKPAYEKQVSVWQVLVKQRTTKLLTSASSLLVPLAMGIDFRLDKQLGERIRRVP